MLEKSFEEQLLELENIVKRLESSDISLEQSLEEYKNGIDIIKNCNLIIKNAEDEVNKLNRELIDE